MAMALTGHAARDHVRSDMLDMEQAGRFEILVFERAGCRYCEVFRADVARRYRELPMARKMPMRFVDVERADIGALRLKADLRIVPTAVVMKDGAELDRVQGLVSAQGFFLLLQHIAGPLE